jgi:hypothetical protein
MKLTDIKFRSDLPSFLNKAGLINFGVEVGVQRGAFSTYLLTYWWGKRLYMIDAWRELSDYQDCANSNPFLQLEHLADVFRSVYTFRDRAIIIRELSDRASELFKDNSLDFVFIDADHSYKGCLSDLKCWYPKVKSGGLLCGHDYMDSSLESTGHTDFGVKSAVDFFIKDLNVNLHTTFEAVMNDKTKTPFGSWFFIK